MNLHTNLDLTQKQEKFLKKVAETAEIHKTAPLITAKQPENSPKKQLKPLKSTKQLPNHSETAGKFSKKVAETAEIHKTAP